MDACIQTVEDVVAERDIATKRKGAKRKLHRPH